MFKNLSFAMNIESIGVEDLANILGIHRNTLNNKINEESDFTLNEAEKIHAVFRKYDFRYLFAREESELRTKDSNQRLKQTGS